MTFIEGDGLTKEAGDLAHGAARQAKTTTRKATEALKARASDLTETARRYAEKGRNQLQVTQRQALSVVRQRPVTSTAVGFAAGIGLGALVAALVARAGPPPRGALKRALRLPRPMR